MAELFEDYRSIGAPGELQSRPIKWRNYFDYGDPVGYRLDTTRRWLGARQITGSISMIAMTSALPGIFCLERRTMTIGRTPRL